MDTFASVELILAAIDLSQCMGLRPQRPCVLSSTVHRRKVGEALKKLIVAWLVFGMAYTASVLAEGEEVSSRTFFASTLDDTRHQPVVLGGLRGKPVLVNFWATWCVPCRAEIPALVDAYERGKSKGLELVGVAVDDNASAVGEFAAAHDMNYPVLIGKEQAMALMRELGNDKVAVPFTVAIDTAGKIVAKKVGILRRGDLERLLASLYAQGGQSGVAVTIQSTETVGIGWLTLKGESAGEEEVPVLFAQRAEVGGMIEKDSAPATVRKQPAVFCLSFGMRISHYRADFAATHSQFQAEWKCRFAADKSPMDDG
jgi:thiol-disulfide isomerase/thioredoxin